MHFSTVLTIIAVSAGLVSAQAPSVPQCVMACSAQAATAARCTSATDVACICTNPTYQSTAGPCVARCTAQEQAVAAQLNQSLCAAAAGGGGGAASSSSTAPHSAKPTSKSGALGGASVNMGVLGMGVGAMLFAL